MSLERIARVIRNHGLHKLAAEVARADGVPAPETWELREVVAALGTKLAMDRLEQRAIQAGLEALRRVNDE